MGVLADSGTTADNFSTWAGDSTMWAEAFVDNGIWQNVEDTALGGWSTWVGAQAGRKLILGVPMLVVSPTTTLATGATGAYNSHYVALAQKLVNMGLANNTIIRLGWEFNGDWYLWAAAGKETHFKNYWIQIVNAMKGVTGASGLKFCWNPALGDLAFPAENAYPGDPYVDYIGLDVYDVMPSDYPWPAGSSSWEIAARRAHVWDILLNGSRGIASWQSFSGNHGKPFAIPEWGVTASAADGIGGLDNPQFIQNMYDYMATHSVSWAVYFDVNQPNNWHHKLSNSDTEFPLSANKFLQLFGGGKKLFAYSSQQAGNEAVKAIDGVDNNDSLRWTGSAATYPQWIEVDLGSAKQINGTELATVSNRAYRFRVETKVQSGNYTTVVDRTANTQAGPIADTFTPVTARYVKLTVTGAYNYADGWTSIKEFKINEYTSPGSTGMTVSAYSSQQAGNEAVKTVDNVDNDDNLRWSGSAATYPQWIEVDWGANKRINGTKLMTMANRAYKFKVEAKPEGGSYTTVVDRLSNTSAGPIANNFTGVTARYLKLTVTGAHNYADGWTSIKEFRVFEGPVIKGYSSQQNNNEASRALDGLEASGNWWSSAVAGYPQWMEVDLGRDVSINGATLYGYQNRAYRYRVEARSAAGSYATVVDRTANTSATPVADTFTAVTARYVRLTVTGAYNYAGNWVSIYELKINTQ